MRVQLKECKGIPLNIPRGYYVLIQVTTMADYRMLFTIKDAISQKIYFAKERAGTNPLPPICDFYQSDCDKPELFIDVSQSGQIDVRMDELDVCDEGGDLIVRTISIVGEDSKDGDYNDLIINLTVMKHCG